MSKQKLSNATIHQIKAPDSGQVEHRFDNSPNLLLISYASGQHSFFFNATIRSQRYRFSLGKFPALSASAAHKAANEHYLKIVSKGLPANETLFSDFVSDEYLPIKTGTKKTVAEDVSKLDRVLLPRFGSLTLNNVTALDIEKLLTDMQRKGLSHSTRNSYLALLKGIFSMAVAKRLIEHSPCDEHRIVPPKNKRKQALSAEQSQRLLEVCRKYAYRPAGNLVEFLLLSGVRTGEALAMRWSDINPEKSVVTLHDSKNGPGEVVLGEAALEFLEALATGAAEGQTYVFEGAIAGKAMSRPSRHFAKMCEEVGLENFCMHDLRRTWASDLFSQGIPVGVISRLLRHGSTAVTERYLSVNDAQLVTAANQSSYTSGGEQHG